MTRRPAPAPSGGHAARPARGARPRRWVRPLALALAVAALALAATLGPGAWLTEAVGAVGSAGPAAPLVAILAGTLLLAALVPRTAVSIGGGALFGPLAGGACALAAALLAAVLTHAAGRWAGRDRLPAGGRLARLDRWLARRGLLAVVVVRLTPVAPFGLVGYAYGATSVRRRHYLLGTLIGATPSAFSYAAVGAAVVRPGDAELLAYLPAAVGALITAAAAVHWRRASARAVTAPR